MTRINRIRVLADMCINNAITIAKRCKYEIVLFFYTVYLSSG